MSLLLMGAQDIRPIPLHQADELQLRSNDFAETYNVWAKQMQSGMLDLTQMKKVEGKFKRLTKAKGWPREEKKMRTDFKNGTTTTTIDFDTEQTVDCIGIFTTDCLCWEPDAPDCGGTDCHWCRGD